MDADALEYACRSRLKWKRDGADWVLFNGRRRMGRVTPAADHPGMYRWEKAGGRFSAIGNLSWVKDAVLAAAVRELEWTMRSKLARDPSKPQQNSVSAAHKSPPVRLAA
jgi:hypothetical protein